MKWDTKYHLIKDAGISIST